MALIVIILLPFPCYVTALMSRMSFTTQQKVVSKYRPVVTCTGTFHCLESNLIIEEDNLLFYVWFYVCAPVGEQVWKELGVIVDGLVEEVSTHLSLPLCELLKTFAGVCVHVHVHWFIRWQAYLGTQDDYYPLPNLTSLSVVINLFDVLWIIPPFSCFLSSPAKPVS